MPETSQKDINAFLSCLTGMHGELIAVLASAWGAPYPLEDLKRAYFYAETAKKELAKGNTTKAGEYFQAGRAIYKRLPAFGL
ncbi:MAG: hypothetical protein GY899_12640 [Verrucomicrobiaceae bacterium]|nr:hypothetical protein [Verrucomicrobiaceae bacterium]